MFTDKQINALKYKSKPYRVYESNADKGFGIQVSTASKSFFVQYLSPITRKRHFMRLGKYPDTPLRMAREQCRIARQQIDNGKDPVMEREQARKRQFAILEAEREQSLIENSTGTVTQLFECYIEKLKINGKKTYREVETLFNNDIKPVIGGLKARDVKPIQIRGIIKSIYMRGAKIRASRARSYIMAAYNFGIRSDNDAINPGEVLFRIETNPVTNIPVPAISKPGERNLSATEIKELWLRLDQSNMALASKTVLRLLLATGGQRLEEVSSMRWDELDFGRKLWELPSTRTKNGKTHVVPLSDLAISLIRGMDNLDIEFTSRPKTKSEYVFPLKDNPDQPMPYNSISRAVNRFCCPPIDKNGKEKYPGFPRFIPKDIRRTVKSRMGEIGISKDIRDRLQNHALHDVSSKHYDRFDYLQPKKDAIATWTKWLETIINSDHSVEDQSVNNYQYKITA